MDGARKSTVIPKDEYQDCSGILMGEAQRRVESLKSIPQGLKPILCFVRLRHD
jgi:hypothetical protein